MEKTYTDKELHSVLEHVKKRFAESETEVDKMYWGWRVRDIEAEIERRKK
jgi:hypothetical protein